MNQLRFSHKVLVTVALVLLLAAALPLAAMEREAPAANKSSAHDLLSGFWNYFTVWFSGGVIPVPEPPSQSTTDNGCAVDPHGGCGG
jgi:hypothetical protein